MSFPLIYVLYFYVVFVFLMLVVAGIELYHMKKFGFKSSLAFVATFLFVACFVLTLVASSISLLRVDWKQKVEVLNFDVKIGF